LLLVFQNGISSTKWHGRVSIIFPPILMILYCFICITHDIDGKTYFLSTSPCFIDSHVTWIYYQYQPFFVNMVVDEFFIWWTLLNFIMSLCAFNCENNFHKFYVDPIIMAFNYNVLKKIPWANGNQSHEKIYVHDLIDHLFEHKDWSLRVWIQWSMSKQHIRMHGNT
jgi:hypothetical protein